GSREPPDRLVRPFHPPPPGPARGLARGIRGRPGAGLEPPGPAGGHRPALAPHPPCAGERLAGSRRPGPHRPPPPGGAPGGDAPSRRGL
ncbi:MAG: hypothetical protein AVDCRST_MAG27-3096, partial [uncultured Craurococcus sp.]